MMMGDAVAPMRHVMTPWPLVITLHCAISVEPPLSRNATFIPEVSDANPVPIRVSITPPPAEPDGLEPEPSLTAVMLSSPLTMTKPLCDAYPKGGTWTRTGDVDSLGQSGIRQVMVVLS